jgi:ppGpp synthetase/RelA/SpoT-type nucleotidyltranferase
VPHISDLWAEHQAGLERIRDELESRLKILCKNFESEQRQFSFRFIESRVKDVRGVKRALNGEECALTELLALDDIVGARIVVPTDSDVEAIVERILVQGPPWHWVREDKNDPVTGYRGVHLKGTSPAANSSPVGCEIQVRTILTDAWSWLSKEYFHHKAANSPWDKMMASVATHLKATDDQLQLIRDEMDEKQIRAPDPRLTISTDPTELPEEASS